jgi:type IV pilus assembly protein PilV
MPNLKSNKGFSLIEVLIAITLLAIGLLAVAGMQTTAITGNSFSQTGTVAVHLAEEMVDRIRSNATTRPDRYAGVNTGSSVTALAAALEEPAETDVLGWKSRLESSLLPNATGTITVDSNVPIGNTATVRVTVGWGLGGNARSVTLTTILETWGT